ncbi:MAG: phage tail protein [Lewinellaceae bacterium]|nr:phage tail protein [Phaeodactylibacter sp.]MCB0612986.1 phage tail protein [Phaeodactylibacter sp.]MCB9351330.1 phage tail protein [Lewinellaceae bacterium]
MPEGYPLPKFHFQVEWGEGDAEFGFTEVSGLDVETEVIEYRVGSSPEFNKTKQPGLKKYSNITMKRGTYKGNNKFFDWWQKTLFFQEGGEKYRRDLTISLMDEEHKPIVVWTVKKAWPTKVQPTDLKADGNEVAIETIEVVHEGLSIEFK